MNKNLKLTVTETIKVPVDQVWHALTDKALIKQYFFGTEAESDWQVDSPLIFRGEWEGSTYEDKGTILKATKNQVLQYSYWSSMSGMEDKPENYATITNELEATEAGTRISVTQRGFRDKEAYKHSTQGWKSVLKGMKDLLER